jgi:glycosyltransferase involved in cell wall biosynthesis
MSKILLFTKIPPPYTGATYINYLINESKVIGDSFKIRRIQISYKKSIESRKSLSFHKLLKIIYYHFCLIKCLIKFQPDIVYFQISPLSWAFFRDCTYVFVIKIFGVHPIYHLHGKGIGNAASKSGILDALYKYVFKSSSIICLSQELSKDVKSVFDGVPYIVPNGIPLEKQHFIRKVDKRRFRILFLSNILVSKGFLVFLDGIKLFKERTNYDFTSTIVGQEVDFTANQINDHINNRNIKDVVRFIGPLYGKDKLDIYNESDVLVFPTLNDIWGLVILEAMQAELPVIATREGAIPQIVDDGETGFLVDKQHPDQIAEKLEILINNSELRNKMGAAGRKKFLETYTFEIFESNMKNVFKDVSAKSIKNN